MKQYIEIMQQWLDAVSPIIFLRYVAAAIMAIVICIALIAYRHHTVMNGYKATLKKLNTLRTQVQEILNEHGMVERQQQEVDRLLSENPDFNLLQHIDLLTRSMKLQSDAAIPTTVDRGDYLEISVRITFTGINIQNLVQLLTSLEHNPRLTIKELEISRGQPKTIDVILNISTLQRKSIPQVG